MIVFAGWVGPLARAAGARPRGRSARRRHRPARVSAAVLAAARSVAAAALAARARRRAANPEAHGAGAVRLVGRADQHSARYVDRVVSDRRQHQLALLLGPPRRVSARRVRHRARDRDPAAAVGAARDAVAADVFRRRSIGRCGSCSSSECRRPSGSRLLAEPLLATLFLRGEFTQRDVEMAAASLRAYAPGLARVHSRQGARAGLFRAPGHAHAGARRPAGAHARHGAVRRVRARAAANGLGARARRHRRGDGVLGAGRTPHCCSRDFGGRASIALGPVGRRSRGG